MVNGPHKPYVHFGLILLVGLVYSLIIARLPLDAFWIIDGGNKFIQVQSMALSGWTDPSVHYPAKDIDPDLAFFPYCGHHYKVIGDKIYSAFPFYFPLVSLVPFRLLGMAGLYLIPLVSSLLCLALTCGILFQLRERRECSIVLLLLAFCTPFLFYSVVFWEHTLAAMLSTLCLLLVLKSREAEHSAIGLLAAGFALGLSTVFREEGYLLFCAVFAGFLYAFHRRSRLIFLVLGWLLVMVPIWTLQYDLYHHFLGIHALIYNASFSSLGGTLRLLDPAYTLGNWFAYLLKFHASPKTAFLMATPIMAAFAVGLASKTSPRATTVKAAVVLCACVTSVTLLIFLLTAEEPVFHTLVTQALFPSTPFLVFFLLYLRPALFSKHADLRFFTGVTLIFLAGSGFLLNQKDVGIVWGPRHFLSLYPILVPLSWIGLRRLIDDAGQGLSRRVLRTGAVLLCTVSLMIQFWGIHTLFLKKRGTEAMVDSIKAFDHEFVVTDVYWFPEEVASIYYRKKILMVDSDEHLSALLALFREKDVRTFTFVTSEQYHGLSNKGLGHIVPLVEETRRITSPGMEFMSLLVSSCRL